MKALYKIALISILLLGIIHCGLSFFIYPDFGKEYFWYLGTGLALLFLAVVNYFNYLDRSDMFRKITCTANIITVLFAGVLAVKFIHVPGILVTVNSALLLFCSLRL